MTTASRRAIQLPRTILVAGLLVVFAILGIGAAPSTAAAPPGTVSWGVAPADTAAGKGRAHFSSTLAPGVTLTDALAVVNRSSTPITLKVYASDAFTTASGGLDLLPAAQRPVDAGSWITFATSTVILASQQSAVLPFTVRVPDNATPGDHTAGVVTSLVTTGDGAAVALDRRLGARYYFRATGALTPGLAISDVRVRYSGSLNPFSSGDATVAYTVTNTGNVRLQAHQSVRIAGPLGLLAHSRPVADLPQLLPGDAITRIVVVHGVWPATRMTASVTLKPIAPAGDPAITVRSATAATAVWTWPIGQLLVLVAVIALAVGYWWLRRRRAKAADAAIADAVARALADR